MTPTKKVTLDPSESQEVAFVYTPKEAKTYHVAINGLSGSFEAILPVEEYPFACPYCSVEFESLASLANHINIAHPEIPAIIQSFTPSEFTWSWVRDTGESGGYVAPISVTALMKAIPAGVDFVDYDIFLYIKIPVDHPYYDPNLPYLELIRTSHMITNSLAGLPCNAARRTPEQNEPGIVDIIFFRTVALPSFYAETGTSGDREAITPWGEKLGPYVYSWVSMPESLWGTYNLYMTIMARNVDVFAKGYGPHPNDCLYDPVSWGTIIFRNLLVGKIIIDS